ncbi:MAG: glycosyltransferase [Legionella sp.]|nr:glycosyltransferase [Legionella sp.]
MRILVITHSYHPANDPRAFRWSAICEYWAQKGIIVDVVCANAESALPKKEQVKGVNVYRVGDPSQRFRSMEFAKVYADGSSEPLWRTKIKHATYALLKKITLMLRWPDFAWFWIPRVYRETKRLLKSHHYDGIFSVAHPFSSHLVAMMLGRRRQEIPWICDYGDPFSFLKESPMNNNRLYERLNKYVERRVIKSSQKITVTTKKTADEYIAHLGGSKEWFHVIPPLVTGNYIFAERDEHAAAATKTVHLLFAGTLYSKIRNPHYLIELLSAVRNAITSCTIKIHFYGNLGDCKQEFEPWKAAINDWIFLHGHVDKSKIMQVYESADILVNIGNSTTYQAPSKVIEYMSTGLPILNITSVEEDSTIPLLKAYPAAFSCFQGDGITENLVNKLGEFFKETQRVDIAVVNEILKHYQSSAIANSYLNLLSATSPC